MGGDMSRVTLNFDLSKIPFVLSSQGQDLYSHQKLNMYWFSSESGYSLTDADDDDNDNAGHHSTTTKVTYCIANKHTTTKQAAEHKAFAFLRHIVTSELQK